MSDDSGRRPFDQRIADGYVGKYILVGLTYLDHEGKEIRRIQRKREPTTALVWLTQIMCVGVLKHVRKDTNGQSGRDHLTGGAAPTLDR